MHGSYNHILVAVSLVVAMLASYTAMDITARIHSLKAAGSKRFGWLLGGAIVMGIGIWSMHFIGMLAFNMPIPLSYDLSITFISLLIAVALSFFALSVISRETLSHARLALGGVVMGSAIAAMHYTGMAALRMRPSVTYEPRLFALSIVIAISAAWTALGIAPLLVDDQTHRVLFKRCGAGLVMGVAIAGMHYTGMRAAIFSANAMSDNASVVNTNWLASTVAWVTLVMLVGTLVFSRIDRGFESASGVMQASLKDANQQLMVLSTRDPLTELANRSALLRRMEEMILRAEATGRLFTVMFTDLDSFKTINDSLGRAVGDELLIDFANHLRACVRRDDLVGRLGGDEFVVLLDGLGTPDDVSPIARDILRRMQQTVVLRGTSLRLTASIGLASYPQDGRLPEELLRHADMAMHDAKHNGKNTYRFYDFEMSKAAARTELIYRALASASERKEMSVHFQPKFNGGSGELIGAEALIRWKHPELGNIPPLEFIPLAESTGQIVGIGNWVIREVCRHINDWDEAGLPPTRIAINLSPEQLCSPDYIEDVLAIVRASGVSPGRILFEITETVAMRDAELSAEVLHAFERAGFDIAIDDFGTGYSSLAYLQQFRVKQLKIDRFFVNGLDSNGAEGLAIVSAIIAMAHSLNMSVVAEGVETQSQLQKLQDLKCDELQGYYLGMPQNAEEFAELVRRRHAIYVG